MSDLLYILGRGSTQNDLELRLSLRSVEKNARNVCRVFIVGNCPDWVQNVIHLPEEDTFQPFSNHFKKVFRAIDGGISENFLLMNDDFYMMRPFDVDKYPYFIREKITNDNQGGAYRQMLFNTFLFLKKQGVDEPLAYNCHTPIIYNCKRFNVLRPLWEEHKRDEIGLSPRIIYGNLFVKTGEVIKDPKIFDDKMPEEIGQSGCISSHSNSVQLLLDLQKIFNQPSNYEKGSK